MCACFRPSLAYNIFGNRKATRSCLPCKGTSTSLLINQMGELSLKQRLIT